MTGLGDGVAVVVGHTTYNLVKKAVVDPKISIGGSLWQPLVNALQASEKLPFEAVAGLTWVGCGLAFFGGLRVGRLVFPWMPKADNGNFATDGALSMAIGGASAAFVGTDVAYLNGDGNFLRPVVGVEEVDTELIGCLKAGTSTALGFAAAQTVQNIAYPKKEAWLD